LLAVVLGLTAFGLSQWRKAWSELEDGGSVEAPSVPLRVSAHEMDQRILYKIDQRILYKIDPLYPEEARRAGMEGTVVLDALIAQDGTVKHLRPIQGVEVLTQSAMDAVQGWRFEPYRSGHDAVEVETTIFLDFRLH
jgi:TonB family protein